MQRGNLLRTDTLQQVLLQQLLEQMMNAIPPLAIIEGDKKEVRALQPVQGGLHLSVRVITLEDRCTQLGAELVQHRDPHEQLLHSRREPVQNFLYQVIAHMAVRRVAKPFHE